MKSEESKVSTYCIYPDCNCPFDMGPEGECLRGLHRDSNMGLFYKSSRKRTLDELAAISQEMGEYDAPVDNEWDCPECNGTGKANNKGIDMNEHIELVNRWLDDSESVSKTELKAKYEDAAYAAASAKYDAAVTNAAARAIGNAASGARYLAAWWAVRYEELTGED